MNSDREKKVPFLEQLEELRKRLIVCLIAVTVGFAVSYGFKERLFHILMQPLIAAMPPGEKMIFTSIPEAFFCYLKVSFLAGILLSIPVIMYELWQFIVPGLYDLERRALMALVFFSSFFFVGGVLFCYFIIFPFAFKYLIGFASELIRPMPSMRGYFSLASTLLLAFGLVFELPLVMTLMAFLGLISPAFMKKNRKYAILLIFTAAAILTPTPDAVTQLLMAVPLMVLYEAGILGAKIFDKKK